VHHMHLLREEERQALEFQGLRTAKRRRRQRRLLLLT
jgi:hypothetical protein